MIHCPNCGTSNQKGSRFCNECGEPLPSTGMRCPMCETINAVGNVYCQACNARLVPMSAPPEGEPEEEDAASRPIKGVSLPTIPLNGEDREGGQPPEESSSEEEPSVPSWLAELRESAANVPEGTQGTEIEGSDPFTTADIPDWLSEMGPIGQESDPTPPSEAPPPTDVGKPPEPGDIPDWIRDLGPITERDAERVEEGQSPQEPGLEESADEDLGPAEAATHEAGLDEAPDWLRDILASGDEARPERGSDDVSEPEGAPDGESLIEIPEWLKEGEKGVPPQPPVAEPEASPPRADPTIPDEPTAGEEEPSDDPLQAVAIPGWLKEAQTGPGEPPTEEPPPPFTEAPPEDVDTPDWLTDLMSSTSPEEKEDVPPFAEEELEVPEPAGGTDLKRAHIPTWLHELRPERAGGRRAAAGPLETAGLLKGLRGVIPSADAMWAPGGARQRMRIHEPDEASLARAELLQSLLGQPTPRARKRSAAETTTPSSLIDRIIVAAVLVAAVVGTLLAPLVVGQGPHLTRPLAAAGATRLYDLIQGLDSQDSVLVAFDYGAPEADELNAAARPVMAHLLERGVELSIVTTRPDGSVVAEDLLGGLGGQYSLLGYRPGAAMAASHLLAATDETPSLLVVLSGQPLPLLLWIEQARATHGDRLPVAAVGSAALEPIASPYLDVTAGQLGGAIFGYPGGSSYEAIQGTTGDATRRLDALAAGHLVIILAMIGGAFVHALRGRQEKAV